jgi:hypothetical protein
MTQHQANNQCYANNKKYSEDETTYNEREGVTASKITFTVFIALHANTGSKNT